VFYRTPTTGFVLGSMQITLERAKMVTPLLRAAIQMQIECWEFQRQIEQRLGICFKNTELTIQDFAAAGEPEMLDDQEAQAFIESLEVEA
jgi:hypothetical protein